MKTIITVYNLSVKIETKNVNLANEINKFIFNFYTSRDKTFIKDGVEFKSYFSRLKDFNVFYLHINQFIHLWNNIKANNLHLSENIEKVDKRNYYIENVDYEIRKGWKLREDQKPIFDFIVSNPVKSKLIPLPTGFGKTVISLISLAAIKYKIGIIILPIYIEKWVNDIISIHDTSIDEIMVVQGSKSLKALIELAKKGELNSKYFIFSSRTLQDFIKNYENYPNEIIDEYGIEPVELFPLLKIGSLLIDEQHQHFHAVFKILLHCNVKFHLALTATLLSDDKVVKRAHTVVFGKNDIYSNIKVDKYIDVYAVNYSIRHDLMRYIRTTNSGSKNYSHIAFENSIARTSFLLKDYLLLIFQAIEDYYLNEYKENDKLLIFVSTVNMANILTNHIRSKIPELVTNRYCEDDPYEHLLVSDIIVSTVISAGTAVDIKNLRVVIQTISIYSQVSNIQSLGRLRKLPDRDVKFVYLYCPYIVKQRLYHLRRLEIFRDRVASIKLVTSKVNINGQ